MFGYPNLQEVIVALGGYVITLMVLMVLDFVLGVLVAVLQKRFEWDKLGNIFVTDGVLILAWTGFQFLLMIPREYIPEVAYQTVQLILGTLGYPVVFLTILGSILKHVSALGIGTQTLRHMGVTPSGENELRPMG